MKFVITTLIALSLHATAFATPGKQLADSLHTSPLQEMLVGADVKKIENAPSYRCVGCFAFEITLQPYSSEASQTYLVHGMDRDGKIGLNVSKIDR